MINFEFQQSLISKQHGEDFLDYTFLILILHNYPKCVLVHAKNIIAIVLQVRS